MQILVTGANGFVGTQVVRTLQERFQVSTLDARTIHQDSKPWKNAVNRSDVLIHLAGRAHITNQLSKIEIYDQVNRDLTLQVARQLSAMPQKKIIFLSSALVYGNQNVNERPFSENDPLHPLGPYAISKQLAEVEIRKISDSTDLTHCIIRPPLVYGPNVKANFLTLLRVVDRGIPLPLGSVNNLRSLVGVRNLVDLIENCLTNPHSKNQTINVTDFHDLSTAALLWQIAEALGKKSRLFKAPVPILKVSLQACIRQSMYTRLCGNFQLDITKARHVLGWCPPFSLDDELSNTAKWFLQDRKW